jgi:hypothetical protein
MYTVETSKHFEKYTDFCTGVDTWVLKNETAPLQKPLYFVSLPCSKDERYYWFVCAFPPGGLMEGSSQTMACLDLETDEIYYHPDVPAGSPAVDPDTGELYFCTPNMVLKKGPRPDSPVERIARVPEKWRVMPGRIATHLTFSADKRELCCDISSGNDTYITSLDIRSGEFELWATLHGGWNHAQFNPADKDLILFAMEFWQDLKTGIRNRIGANEKGQLTRIWTIRRGEQPVNHLPVYKEASHEWWSADGKKIYYCDWRKGIGMIDFHSGERKLIHPTGYRHGYSSTDDRYFVADIFNYNDQWHWYRGCATTANFYNTETSRPVDIVTRNPALYTFDDPCVYHIDAHPRFVFNDKYVAYCTTVFGKPSVGFAKTAQLVEFTSN